MNNRNTKDVHLGGLVGIALATLVSGGLACSSWPEERPGHRPRQADLQATTCLRASSAQRPRHHDVAARLGDFPSSCFSSLIAANSFKTTLPKINPWISVGIGTLGSISAGRHGLGRRCDRGVHRHRRVVRADLRGDGGRLPAGRMQMARAARRFQSGGLDFVGGRVRRGRRRIDSRPKAALSPQSPVRRWPRSSSDSCFTPCWPRSAFKLGR